MVAEWGLVQSVSIDDVVWRGLSMIDPPRCPKKWACSVASWFGHWQDNITGWQLKVSVQLMYSWTSTSVLQGYRLGAVGVVPFENQVSIMIFQFCQHITFHMIYEWFNCAISRPVYGPKHSWPSVTVAFYSMADVGISTWKDFLSVDCPVGSNINGGYAHNSLASMTLKSRDLLLINNPINRA